MKNHSTNLSQHLHRFKSLSRKVNRLVESGRFQSLSQPTRQRLIARLRAMYEGLRRVTGARMLKRSLAAAALVLGLGITQTAEAQIVPNFAAPQTNPFSLVPDSSYNIPELVDMDGDGDLDLIGTSLYSKIYYYENVGSATAPSFGTRVDNPFGINLSVNVGFVTAGDLDSDGDVDLIVGENYYGTFTFYENTGTATAPAFAAPQINPFGLDSLYGLSIPEFVDLDGDGDLDILATGYSADFQYFENTGTPTAPAFAAPVANPFGLVALTYIQIACAADFDNDGDEDVLVNNYDGDFVFFENTGTSTAPAFGSPQTNPFNLTLPTPYLSLPTEGDLDGDGDIDVVCGFYYGTILYYENTPIVSTQDPVVVSAPDLFPNPVLNQLWLTWDAGITAKDIQIEVMDLQGKILVTQQMPMTGGRMDGSVDVSNLAAGSYLVRLTGGQTTSMKKFVKQ